MAMNETLPIAGLVLEQVADGRLVLGCVFFGGLWWTLRKEPGVSQTAGAVVLG
jgi:hypothetical protein